MEESSMWDFVSLHLLVLNIFTINAAISQRKGSNLFLHRKKQKNKNLLFFFFQQLRNKKKIAFPEPKPQTSLSQECTIQKSNCSPYAVLLTNWEQVTVNAQNNEKIANRCWFKNSVLYKDKPCTAPPSTYCYLL